MTNETKQLLDKIIKAANGNIIGFCVNAKTKKDFDLPNEYKNLKIISSLLIPFDMVYSIPPKHGKYD